MPQTRGLKTPDIRPPTGVKARSPRSRCPRAAPLRGSREVPSCVFQPLQPQASLGCGHTPPVSASSSPVRVHLCVHLPFDKDTVLLA